MAANRVGSPRDGTKPAVRTAIVMPTTPAMSEAINTKTVTARRELTFGKLRDALRDVQSFGDRGPSRTLGNWTAAQIVEHIALTMDHSVDGFPLEMHPPLPMKLIGRLLKRPIINNRMRPGIKMPKYMKRVLPAPDVSWGRAVDHLRRSIERFEKASTLSASPFFGSMSREEWTKLHCRHAEMHFGFMA